LFGGLKADLTAAAMLRRLGTPYSHKYVRMCAFVATQPISKAAPVFRRKSTMRFNRGSPFYRQNSSRDALGTVEIHREFITAAARWIFAAKLWSVLSARMAMRLNSLSLQKKFSIR